MIKFDKKTSQYIIDDDNKDLYTLQDFETTASIDALYKLVLIHKTDTGNEHFNYYDREGMTPLCFCCLNQVDIRNIYYFVNDENDISPKPVKTDINRKSAKGKSPFQYAVLSRYMEMITLLHEGTIKVPVLDDEGKPKLQLDKWQDPVLDSNGDPIIITETYNIYPTVTIETNDYIVAVMMPDDKVIKALLPVDIPPADNEYNDPIVKKLDVSKQTDSQSHSNILLLACLAQAYGTITTLLSASLAYGDIAESITNTNKNKKSAYSTTIELNDTGAQKLLDKYLEKVDVVYLYAMYNGWMQKDEDGNIDELFNPKAEKAVEDLYKSEHFTKLIDNKLYNVIDHLGNNHYFSQSDIAIIKSAIKNETLDKKKLPHWEYTPAGIDFDTSIIERIEGAEGAKRTFKLNAKPKSNVIITIKSDHDDRLSISSSSLTFTPSNWNTDQTVTFTAIDDHIANGDLYFSITISTSSGDSRFNDIKNTVQVKIKDNDEVGITYDDSLITLNEGQSAIRTFKLKSQPLSDVILNISSDHDDKLIISSKSLTFTSSNWNTNQSVTFTAIDDNIVSGNLDFNIKIKPSSTDTLYNNIPEKIIPITIKDNDTAGIIYDNSSVTINEGQSITRSFKLKSQPVSDVTLNISSNNSSRLIISSNKLTFNQSNWDDEHYVVFSSIDDNISNGDTTIIVTIKSVSTDTIYNNIPDGTITITVKDNDTSGIITDNSSVTITEGQSTTKSFRLQSQPTSNVILNISSSNNSKLSISKSSLTFTQSNWNIEQPVVLTAIDNNITDGDVDVSITIKSMSADSAYNNLTSGFKVTIKDNDIATPGIIIDSDLNVTITEGQYITRTFKLKSQPKSNVTLNISSNNNSRLSITPQSLTFTSSNWNTTQSVRFTAIDNSIIDGDTVVSVTVKSVSDDTNYNNLASGFAITIKDNDVDNKLGTLMFTTSTFAVDYAKESFENLITKDKTANTLRSWITTYDDIKPQTFNILYNDVEDP